MEAKFIGWIEVFANRNYHATSLAEFDRGTLLFAPQIHTIIENSAEIQRNV